MTVPGAILKYELWKRDDLLGLLCLKAIVNEMKLNLEATDKIRCVDP
jgi:hypothetical protein